ncbi:MAG: hypothetical protein ACOWWM_04725 [Desulfobacterales bacterium]|jgi:hypothetical protein
MEHIKGIIIPSDWDSNGEVTGVSIATFDERVVRVSDHGAGKELVSFLRYQIDGWGELVNAPEGPILLLSRFQVKEPASA